MFHVVWAKALGQVAHKYVWFALSHDNLTPLNGFGAIIRRLLEILASRKAIEFAIEAGFTILVIKGDNSNVMKTITDYGSHVSRLGHIVLDIQMFTQGLQWSSVNCIWCSANSSEFAS